MDRIIRFVVFVFLLALPVVTRAQTPTPAPAPATLPTDNGWNVSFNGGFSTINGGTNNGVALVQELRLSTHLAIRADEYILNSPNTTITLGGLEYRFSAASIFKNSTYAVNAKNVEFFANGGLGTAHATVPASANITARHLAVGVGGGFDYCVTPTVCIRPLDLKYVNGGSFTKGVSMLGNGLSFQAGIGLRF